MSTTEEQVRERIYWLRQDERFDDLVVEAIRREASLNKLVVTGKVPTEDIREFALKTIEAAMLRFAQSELELPDDGRYSDQLEKTFERLGIYAGASHEQTAMWRSVFRFMHAALKNHLSDDDAWRAVGLITPRIIEALGSLNSALMPIINDYE